MARLVSFAALPALGLALIAGGGASSSPPSSLSPYGRLVWNLDAVLHDSFGTRRVYLAYHGQQRGPWDFQTQSTADCCGGYWLFTFAHARRSAFRLVRPMVPPRANNGAAGGEIPLTIRGKYIRCGNGRWLYIHYGNGPTNTLLSCFP